jgi:hypothetical protein
VHDISSKCSVLFFYLLYSPQAGSYFPARVCRQSFTLCDRGYGESLSFLSHRGICMLPHAYSSRIEINKSENHDRHRLLSPLSSPGPGAYPSVDTCCVPGAAFTDGCSALPPLPCHVIDSYFPRRTCREDSDPTVCYRGWGVYRTNEICCEPGVAFTDGCST